MKVQTFHSPSIERISYHWVLLEYLTILFSLLLVPNSNEIHMSFMWAFLLSLQSQLLSLAWFLMCGYQLTHSTQYILMSSNPCAHANCFNIWSMHYVFLFSSTSNHKVCMKSKVITQYKPTSILNNISPLVCSDLTSCNGRHYVSLSWSAIKEYYKKRVFLGLLTSYSTT